MIGARLAAAMASRPVAPDLSIHYLSDADWCEVDGVLASRDEPGVICDRLLGLLVRARARLPVMRPIPRKHFCAGLGLAARFGAAGGD